MKLDLALSHHCGLRNIVNASSSHILLDFAKVVVCMLPVFTLTICSCPYYFVVLVTLQAAATSNDGSQWNLLHWLLSTV